MLWRKRTLRRAEFIRTFHWPRGLLERLEKHHVGFARKDSALVSRGIPSHDVPLSCDVLDLHRAGGLWLWAMLFVFAWSSVAFNLTPAYDAVMRKQAERLNAMGGQ